MKSPVIKTYDDGSEMTVGKLAVALTAGAILATAYSVTLVKLSDWRERRRYERMMRTASETLKK